MTRRRVCIVVNSRANYGRIKSVLEAVRQHPSLELKLVVGASALLYRFGNVREVMARDGFVPDATVYTIVEGETPTTMAKSTGLAIMELATIFENLAPTIVLTGPRKHQQLAVSRRLTYFGFELETDIEPLGGVIPPQLREAARLGLARALLEGETPHPDQGRIRRAAATLTEWWRRSGG